MMLVGKAIVNDSFIQFVIREKGVKVMYEIAWNLVATEGGYVDDKYKVKVYKTRGYYQSFTDKFMIFQNAQLYYDSDFLSLSFNIKT